MFDHRVLESVRSSGQRLISIKETCQILGIGRTHVYGLLGDGRLHSVTIGRRRLVPAEAIEAFVASLNARQGGAPS